jgi:hypothetical protein
VQRRAKRSKIAFPVVSEWCQYRTRSHLLGSTPAPQDKQPSRAEDGHKRREKIPADTIAALVGSNERRDKIRYVILAPSAPAVTPAPTTIRRMSRLFPPYRRACSVR